MHVDSSRRPRRVVALGSSFAAGPGIAPVVDAAAMRSGRNYAHLLADRLGADLVDLTVSGATTATLTEAPQRVGRRTFAPQVAGIPADADLVTVTAGGNDLAYSAGMLRAAWGGWLGRPWPLRPLGALVRRGAVPTVGAADLARTTAGLVEVVRAAAARAPSARIVLVDYLSVFGPDTRPGRATPVTVQEIRAFRTIAGQLAEAFDRAATTAQVELVQASALSKDHGLGSDDPWVTGFRPGMKPMPFHPDARGMQVVADALHELVA